MCRFASFYLTRDRELWVPASVELDDPKQYDSHQRIIDHYQLHEDGVRGPNGVRVEIFPTSATVRFSDLSTWGFRVDQDLLPEWAVKEELESRTRSALVRRIEEGLRYVDASGCTALTSLEAKVAEYVYASGCTALTELRADAAKTVYARGCTALHSPKKGGWIR